MPGRRVHVSVSVRTRWRKSAVVAGVAFGVWVRSASSVTAGIAVVQLLFAFFGFEGLQGCKREQRKEAQQNCMRNLPLWGLDRNC